MKLDALLKNQKVMIGAAVAVLALILVGGGIFAYKQMSPGEEAVAPAASTKPKRRSSSVKPNLIPVAERPYQLIRPIDSRNVEIIIQDIKKTATEVEYELEYQAGSLLQAAFDSIDISSLPGKKTVLFGSCSAGGACTYHTDIKGGSLLTRFSGGEGDPYAVKSDWTYFEGRNLGTAKVISTDEKFELSAASLKTAGIAIVYNSPGYPEGLEGQPISDPYTVTATGSLKGEGEVTIEANEADGTIMAWNGTAWVEMSSKASGNDVTATGEIMPLYIVVKK
jgi:hypothetical protein